MLPSINLLPWRQQYQRQLNKRFFLQLLGVCLLTALLSCLAGALMHCAFLWQEQRNGLLRTAIESSADTEGEFMRWQKTYQAWQAQLSLVGMLEGDHMQTARLLSRLAQAVPDQLKFSHLQRNGDRLHVRGEAQASKAMAALVERMEGHDEWREVVLSDVRAVENGISHFELGFQQARP